MFCSSCNQILKPIQLRSGMGKVVLDYCPNCGGVWSDQGEINFIKHNDLKPLLSMLPQNPALVQNRPVYCPRDRQTLKILQSESVPSDLGIYQCSKCNGDFFPYGVLFKFKAAQEAKINYFKTWNIPLTSVFNILLPVLVVVILGGGLVAGLYSIQQRQQQYIRAQDLISKPLILPLESGSVLISFTSQKPLITQIKYWPKSGEFKEVWVSTQAQKQHIIQLDHLDRGQVYSFEIISTEPEFFISPIYTFQTANH